MNATNRALNRAILLTVGLVLTVAGAGAVLAAVWHPARDTWTQGTASIITALQDANAATQLNPATTVSGVTLAVLGGLALLVILAIIVIARLGGGHSAAALRVEAEPDSVRGPVIVRNAFTAETLARALDADPTILHTRVVSRRIRGENVTQVSVTPRRATCPVEVSRTVELMLDNLATLTGSHTPTLVSIRSSLRSRFAADQPRVH